MCATVNSYILTIFRENEIIICDFSVCGVSKRHNQRITGFSDELHCSSPLNLIERVKSSALCAV